MSFFSELKRRNVFRVGIAYALMGWVLLQAADFVLDLIGAPNWVIQAFALAVALGLPVALFFAWAFEMTPEGIKRESEVDRSQSITPKTGRKLDYAIIGFLVMIIASMAVERVFFAERAASTVQPEAPPAAPDKTIAVLPFADLSRDQDQGWFADGLAEEILNALAKTPDLQVSSRTSTLRYRDSELGISQIARELGVAHILEGSVRSGGGRIRVTAQLIRAEDGFHVWSENYDRDEADMISIQEDLARNIANALETTMDPEALAAMSNAGTRSVEAYKHYLQGLNLYEGAFASASGPEVFLSGYQHFERARDIDPGFANAHWQAAEFWKVQLSPSRTDSGVTELTPVEMLVAFNERIDQAITAAPTEIDRIRFLANKAEVELRIRDAISLYQQYLEARPNDEITRFNLVNVANIASDDDIRIRALERWREKATNDVWAINSFINEAYRVIDPSDAADVGLAALQRWPTANGLIYQTHRTLMWAGRIAEGRQLHDRFYRLNPEGSLLVAMRQACAEGRRDDAEKIFERLDPDENDYVSELWHMYKLLGREQEAIEVLRPIGESGVPYQLATHLTYHKFDPSPFPSVMAVLEREGIERPPAVEIPFKCPPPEQPSIAVLPFVNMSADPENEFFSDGIAEEILNVLASIPELKVAARTSAFAYKGTDASIPRIAGELGVNHVLEGSVRKAGNQVRVTAQLIKAEDGFHLWSDTYDRELTNIFAIQDEIAGAIANALKVSLELEGRNADNLTGTRSIEAYEHYLRGMQLWHLRTADSLYQAVESFEAAIALDPGFAKAHAGLALTWGVLPGYVNLDEDMAYSRAAEAANRALALDPENVEATAALGLVDRTQLRFEQGAAQFRRAIDLNPSYATAHQWYGGMLGEMGDPEAGVAAYRKAWSLDPRSRIIGNNLAWRLSGLGQIREALEVSGEVLAFAPEFPDGISQMMTLHILTANCDEAAVYGRQLVRLLMKKVDSLPVYADLCQREDARKQAEAAEAILAWPEIDFANPEHPTLNYYNELILLLVELKLFDAAWTLIEADYSAPFGIIAYLRSRHTPNGVRFQCTARFRAHEERLNLPPAVVPPNCAGQDDS